MGRARHVGWWAGAALAWSASAAASDASAEALARRVAATPGAGEVHWLDGARREALALYAPERVTPARGAVVLVPGLGRHADWPGPVASLRRRLPDAGWQTLSVQLPTPDRAAPVAVQSEIVEIALERIAAARRFLAERGAGTVVIVGHRWGAGVAARSVEQAPQGVGALVAIAPTHAAPGPDAAEFAAIVERLEVPLLEVVVAGSPAPPAAVRPPEAPVRDRIEIDAAEPSLAGAEEAVYKRLRAWLERNAPREADRGAR